MVVSRVFRILQGAMLTAALPALALAAVPAAAQSPQAIIAARQAGFKKMGAAMKVLKAQLDSGAPAKDVMANAARTIALTAPQQAKMFPAGTGASAGVKTDALPNIWTDRANFDALMVRLVGETAKLQAVAGGGDAAAIAAQTKATGAACAACHRQFRADN
ncbi:MAG: cytochrome c [Sphingomonas sp.]|nr:cytochrome c [Sphingomonas sp.]